VIEVTHEPVREVTRFQGQPLAIVGAGPSYSDELAQGLLNVGDRVNVFALNHTITELFRHPLHWWVSNDMDRTFGNPNIAAGICPRLEGYDQWRMVTQRLFIPGPFGDHHWWGRNDDPREAMDFRLPCPSGSHVAWYFGGEGKNETLKGYVRNGHSVLELALEVATLWGFDPIVLFGCDMKMPTVATYYAEQFRWKPTPAKVARGKLRQARQSIVDNRKRWKRDIFHVTGMWDESPFKLSTRDEAAAILGVESEVWV